MSETHQNPAGSDPCEPDRREEPMLHEDTVQEVLRDSRGARKSKPLPASSAWIATLSSGGGHSRGVLGRAAWIRTEID